MTNAASLRQGSGRQALITKLESAQEGSRALSKGVFRLLGYRMMADGKGWMASNGLRISQKADPTRNLQDAVDLVPEGWLVSISQDINERWHCSLINRCADEDDLDNIYEEVRALHVPTAPLGICIAILKTMEAADG